MPDVVEQHRATMDEAVTGRHEQNRGPVAEHRLSSFILSSSLVGLAFNWCG